jgi:hypothetical protein
MSAKGPDQQKYFLSELASILLMGQLASAERRKNFINFVSFLPKHRPVLLDSASELLDLRRLKVEQLRAFVYSEYTLFGDKSKTI